jgi:hypothetical protein
MSFDGQKLLQLLPALYLLKDAKLARLTADEAARLVDLKAAPPPLGAERQKELSQLLARARGPLHSLLMLIAEHVAAIEEDLEQLYDDLFIETCAPWVIPYIGDLIGFQEINGVVPSVASPRAEVAHTISFRRRKGTLLVLEQFARDVTGWGAHAVEFFELLAVTQYMNHVRPDNRCAPDLRGWRPREYMNTAFDRTAHCVDTRRIAAQRGRYNIKNIGLFLWSLNAYRIACAPCTPSPVNETRCFRFSTLGADMPLFNRPFSQGAEITAPAQPIHVPDRLRRSVLCDDLRRGAGSFYYGEENSLALYLNEQLLDPRLIQICDLSGEEESWANMPAAGSLYAAAIDPLLGRIALTPAASPATPPPTVKALFHYGFNADMAGGEYRRADTFAVEDPSSVLFFPDTQVPARYETLQQALDEALMQLALTNGEMAVEICDSGVYRPSEKDPMTLQVHVPSRATLELRAKEGCRPTLVLEREMTVTGEAESAFALNGILLTCKRPSSITSAPKALVHVPVDPANKLDRLSLTHCTLVPGLALTPTCDPEPDYSSLPVMLLESPGLNLIVEKSILGAIRIHGLATAAISSSIVDATGPCKVAYAAPDGTGPGGALNAQGCTIVGKTHATSLSMISNAIFWAGLDPDDSWKTPLRTVRKQQGCVRFSYLPENPVAPRRFNCVLQGETTLPGETGQPLFVSLRYGDPGYCKLFPGTSDSVRRGADDGGEMGAFHFLLAPLRETDLRVRIQEYLPVGMESGILYET